MSNVKIIRKEKTITTMSDGELIRAIRTRLNLTVEGIEELADLIREARRRTISLSEFSTGLPGKLIAVADGLLDAEILLKFCDHAALLNSMIGIPLKTQKRLAKDEEISVVEFDTVTGGFKTVQKPLTRLTGPQCRQVFAAGEILTPVQQKKQIKSILAASKRHVSKPSTNPLKGPKITADPTTGDIIVGPFRIRAQAFFIALKTLGYKVTKS